MTPHADLVARLELALNEALLGRGTMTANVQRNYRLSFADADRLMKLRAACFDALGALAALPPPADPPMVPESPLAHAAVEATARAHGWDAEQDTLAGWLHRRLSRPADPPALPGYVSLRVVSDLISRRSVSGGWLVSPNDLRNQIEDRAEALSRPADPPALVALVADVLAAAWQLDNKPHQLFSALRRLALAHPNTTTDETVRLLDVAYERAERLIPAAPPVTLTTTAVSDPVVVVNGPQYSTGADGDMRVVWPVTDTPQGWQPIETAPKDGHAVIALTWNNERCVVHWNGSDWRYAGDGWCGGSAPRITRWHEMPAAPPQEDQ